MAALCCHAVVFVLVSLVANGDEIKRQLQVGVALQTNGDLGAAEKIYYQVLEERPKQADALHLLGLVRHARSEHEAAVDYIEKAIAARPNDPNILANLGEVRRCAGDLDGAKSALEVATRIAPQSVLAWRNMVVVFQQQQDFVATEIAARRLMNLQYEVHVLLDLADAIHKQRRLNEAEILFGQAVQEAANDSKAKSRALLGWGVTAQQSGRLDEAATRYEEALLIASPTELSTTSSEAKQARVNLASVFHERGQIEDAIQGYESALALAPNDTQALNNLGAALITVSRHDEAVRALERCLALDADQPQALTNLATHYANEGDQEIARTYFTKARSVLTPESDGKYNAGLLMRELTMMAPMSHNTSHMYWERAALAVRILTLKHALHTKNVTLFLPPDPVSSVEQVQFYLPYAGLNDRFLQEALSDIYQRLSPELSWLGTERTTIDKLKKIRVGFVSKFFGEYEPHGLLLEGVVQHLPRRLFEVVVLPIASPGRPAASELLTKMADELWPLGLNFLHTRRTIAQARLDVLVYADMLSEPMTYFLGFSRLAPVQMLFWGNPVTSGRGMQIDYFISADIMEAPERTKLPASLEPYSEQVVLLEGQGIWYRRPQYHDDNFTLLAPGESGRFEQAAKLRTELFGLPYGNYTLLLCPQSLFKLHPKFDTIVRRILEAAPNSRVLFTQGRRQRWTAVLEARLRAALGDKLYDERLLFLPRQPPGSAFMRLVALADVMLHPFPFGGSRTSSDGLAVGVPVVTRPTANLRARMAVSFYATMEMTAPEWCLVASDSDQYIHFAARLANDHTHRARVAAAIRERSPRIWEKREDIFEWARLLSRVAGRPAPTPDEVGWKRESLPKSALGIAQLSSQGRTQFGEGRLTEAVHSLQTALKLCDFSCKDEAKLRSDLGATLQQLGRLDLAEAELRRSLDLDPTSTVALNNLAVTLHEAGDLEASRAWYSLALQTGTTLEDRATALYNAANAHRDAGNIASARDALVDGLGLQKKTALSVAATALLEPANHHVMGETLVDTLRSKALLQAANSLVILEDHLALTATPEQRQRVALLYDRIGRRGPWFLPPLDSSQSVLPFGQESAPTEAEMMPLGGGSLLGVHLIVQPYKAEEATRRAEIALALMSNLQHVRIDKVHTLVELEEDEAFVYEVAAAANASSKLMCTRIGHRLTLADISAYATKHLLNQIVIFANADIFFEVSLARLGDARTLDLDNKVFALLRWDWQCSIRLPSSLKDMSDLVLPQISLNTMRCGRLGARVDSQDAWIFRSPFPLEDTALLSRVEIGRARCDNHIAALLSSASKEIQVSSPSLAIRALHIQNKIVSSSSSSAATASNETTEVPSLRSYTSPTEIKGNIKYIPISEQWLF